LQAAARLPSRPGAPDRGATYRMIFALLYGLGLRVGEVCHLRLGDLDARCSLLVIRESKFRKTRLVPFGPRIARVLADYVQQQVDRYGTIAPEQPLFSFSRPTARPICPNTISWTFHQLLRALSLTVPAGVAPPHLHCLRHSFAVGTLLRWYREGVDPAARLIHLSTFLGHVGPSATAVYLTVTGPLLQEANARFERFAAPVLQEISS
jgi:integrase